MKLLKHLRHLICKPPGGICASLMLYSAPHLGQVIFIAHILSNCKTGHIHGISASYHRLNRPQHSFGL
jgi:hypothetical protein